MGHFSSEGLSDDKLFNCIFCWRRFEAWKNAVCSILSFTCGGILSAGSEVHKLIRGCLVHRIRNTVVVDGLIEAECANLSVFIAFVRVISS